MSPATPQRVPAESMTAQAESWLALNLVERVGGRTVRRLLDAFGSVEGVLAAPAEVIEQRCGLAPKLAARVARARQVPAFRIERGLVQQHAVQLVPMDDPSYPARLGEVYAPPPLLYAKGLWPVPPGPRLAVVGTRAHSPYGERITARLIAALAELEPAAVIVSGLARGIDTVAHEQALACGLHTVAVLGGGLTGIYPPENLGLAERIQGRGALLSEFPMTARPLARNFPVRNRVIAGLADAVLVVEAGVRSGALITASFALNYGRPVLAVPGNADEPAGEGANRLIQSGQGRMVLSGADVLAALQEAPSRGASASARTPVRRRAAGGDGGNTDRRAVAPRRSRGAAVEPAAASGGHAELGGDKGRMLTCLRRGALHPDELARETALPIERLIALLLELELAGAIRQTPESRYALA